MPTPKIQFNVSLTVPEYNALQIAANAQGLKVASFVRALVVKRVGVNISPKDRRPATEVWRTNTDEEEEDV